MTTRFITSYEIVEKQQSIISDYQKSRSRMSLAGIRQLAGSTFIAIGERMYGCVEQRRSKASSPIVVTPARGI